MAFLGLLAGGEHPGARAQRFRDPMMGYYPAVMPRYPGAVELPAGPEGQVGGARVRMSVFTTEDEPAKIARFYSNHWQQQRLYVREDVTHVGGTVSAVDVGAGKVYQALMVRRGKRTSVFPSVTSAPLEAMTPAQSAPVVPHYPGSTTVIALSSREERTRARVWLSTNSGPMRDNLAHYRRALRAAGFAEEIKQPAPADSSGKGPGYRMLLFRKEGSEVTVTLSPIAEERIRVHVMEVGS